jgi:hypothetical protein
MVRECRQRAAANWASVPWLPNGIVWDCSSHNQLVNGFEDHTAYLIIQDCWHVEQVNAEVYRVKVRIRVTLRLAVYRQSVFLETQSFCNILPDERMNQSFTIDADPRQRSHSRVWVPRDSWPYFTIPDSRLSQPGGPGPRIYKPQEQGGPVIHPGSKLKVYKKFWEELIACFPLIRHGAHRKRRVQKSVYCCMCIPCSGNVA